MQPTHDDPTVVALCGSLGDDSVTRLALTRALDAAADRGAETDLIDLRNYDLPLFDPDGETPPDATELADRIDAADALLLGSPMYNGSYCSPIKAAIDYSDPDSFDDLPVGLVVVSGGSFPTRPLDHLREVASHMGARVLPDEVAVPDSHRVDDDLPADVAERLDDIGEQIVAAATHRPSAACDVAASAGD